MFLRSAIESRIRYSGQARQHCGTGNPLQQQGVDVDATDRQHGATALMWAGHEGRIEAVRFLLSHGAGINA